MTRAELIEMLTQKYKDMNPRAVDLAVRDIFSIMTDTLSKGDRIEIRGFGSFELRERQPRQAHNPKTGEKVELGARRVVHFKPGSELKNRVNSYKDKA